MTVTAQATFVATLVDEWVRAGVTDAVVAPGSRSTPLTLGIARDGRLRIHVHLDERAAGFFAVGLGMASGRPAVVVTTSGTAAVELHAAVVEASQARVPVIVCTADRPPELHHVHAPQTVEQGRLYGDAVRWFFDPGSADSLPPDQWRSIASRSFLEAVASPTGPGPVHLNLPFRDPLVGSPGELPGGRAHGAAWHRATPGSEVVASPSFLDAGSGRGVIVAGAGAHVRPGVFDVPWPVLADPRSGLRGTTNAIAAFDGILRSGKAPVPDVVLRVGDAPASKVLSQWLAALPETTAQIIVDPFGGWPDPERRAHSRMVAVPAIEARDQAWCDWWNDADAAAQRAIDDVLNAAGRDSEPGVIRRLTRDSDPATTFFVSSSMPIRDIEWFGHPESCHRVLSNRGANGIDGVVSTALGTAAADPSVPVTAIVGDLAFLYDAGALLWAARRDVDLTIVVLDNDGGGIFSFLPQRVDLEETTFERYFGTPHGVDIAAVASVHGIELLDSLDDVVERRGRGVRLLVVKTDRDANVAIHDELQARIAAAIS